MGLQRTLSISRPKSLQLLCLSLHSWSWASNHYAIMPDNVARGRFLVKLVRDNLDWIGVDPNKGSIKVLDYGAGTGFLTQVGFFLVDVKEKHPQSSDNALGVHSLREPSPRDRRLAWYGWKTQ